MEQSELDELFTHVSMKPGHRVRFRKALSSSLIESDNHNRGSQHQRECPVCLIGPASDVNVVLMPCGHVFCAQHAADASGTQQCPVCRSTVTSAQRAFV